MGRSRDRSLSPVRRKRAKERDRSKKRKRNRDERRRRSRSNSREERRRSRSRSRSYERRHHRSPSPYTSKSKISPVNVSASDLEGKTPDEIEMMKVMGFCGFDSTKNKKVEGNNVGEVHVILKRKYRQYMNRKGGFNRPLDFVA